MTRANHCEVPMIKRGDLGGTQTFSDRNDRRVHCTQTEVGVLLNQLRRSFEVGIDHVLYIEPTGDEAAEEGALYGAWAPWASR